MNPYDQYPLDHTGHGPAGTGGAPTMRELHQHQRNLHMTNRMAQAVQHIDPVTLAAAQKLTRMQIGGNPTPDALRRGMFNSAAGQLALDASLLGRATGILGQGDPVTAAANIAQGVAGGGFRTSIGGANSYGSGPTSGAGHIAEHVSMTFMKGIMSDMYGGTGDTSRMNGFSAQDTSQIFKTLAQRGGIGHVAHLQREANINTRLDAATNNAVDLSIKAELAGIKLSGVTESERIASLQGIANKTDNKKLEQELNKVIQAPDALIINTGEQKRVQQVVKDITEGLSSLADVYQDLSAPELQSKLEAISGIRITNREQAAKASAMVNQLRGAAVVSGMDPKAFLDWSMDMQAQLRGDVTQSIGADGRHGSMVTSMTAGIHNQIMVDSALAQKQAIQAVMQGRELGVDLGEAPSMPEIYEDKRQGRMQFLERYAGVTMAQGGMDNLSGDQRKQAEKLLAEFQKTTDPDKRTAIEEQMQSVWAAAYSRPGQEVDFGAVMASRSGKRMMENAFRDPASAREMERMAAIGRRDALNINPMINQLEAMGIGGAEGTGKQLLSELGMKGMGDLLRVSRLDFALDDKGQASDKKLSGKDRVQMQRDMLGRAGMKGPAADQFLSKFFDQDGRVKDEKGYKQAMQFLNDADYEPGMSTYDQQDIGNSRLEMIGANSGRQKMSDADSKLSLNSIATALATGGMSSRDFGNPESMVLMMETLGEAGIPIPQLKGADGKMVDAKSQYAKGIDFSKGLTKEGMDKLRGIHGKDLDLHKKLTDSRTGEKFASMEALMEATKGDKNLLADAIGLLQTDKDYLGLNLSGGIGSMTSITDAGKDSFTNNGAVQKRFRQAGGAMMIAKSMGLGADYENSITQSIEEGRTPDLGMFAADKFDGLAKAAKGGEKVDAGLGTGFSRIMGLSSLIGSSSGEEMAQLSALNEGGQMTGHLEKQLKQLEAAKKGDATTASYKVDGKDVSSNIDAAMKQISAAIKKLENQDLAEKGATVVNEMIVQNIRLENPIKEPGS